MDVREMHEQRYGIVRQSNDMIQEARYSLTLQQQKILLYLISQIQPSDTELKTYEFAVSDFCKVAGISNSGGKVYEMVKESIKGLADNSFWIRSLGKEKLLRWISEAEIESGQISVQIHKDLMPYLIQLKSHYTEFELVYTLRMKHTASVRLYELLVSYQFNKLDEYKKKIKLDELREILDCTSKTYQDWYEFKRRIIEPSVKEINLLTDKTISYTVVKRGRWVDGVVFKIATKTADERVRIMDEVEKEFDQLSMFDSFRRDWI